MPFLLQGCAVLSQGVIEKPVDGVSRFEYRSNYKEVP